MDKHDTEMNAKKDITLFLPDKSKRQLPCGATGATLLKTLPGRITKEALAIMMNGRVQDLCQPLVDNANIRVLTWEDPEGKQAFWHSSAHLLCQALKSLYPTISFGTGPAIETGFYYDIDFGDISFEANDLPKVTEKMLSLAREKNTFERRRVSKKEAVAYFTQQKNPYKLEILEGLQEGEITFYQHGDFVDLCKGPHIPHTGHIKGIKLLGIGGAYWRGDEHRPQLLRIRGISFPKASQLAAYLALREEAKKRDHRKLGKELDLFTFSEEVGIGLPLWKPKGAFVRQQLMKFLHKTQTQAGYQMVATPHIGHKNLYVTSGHYDKYKEDTFKEITTSQEGESFFLKPMNCPHHAILYKSAPKSYKDLPIRLAEFGTVYRYEKSGQLSGLTRARSFTQDDAHIFCRPDQVKQEVIQVIDIVLGVLKAFQFTDYAVHISVRDPENQEKYIGDHDLWEMAEQSLQQAAAARHLNTVVMPGEAAFYGPKIDFVVQDALKRKWQLGTVQVDYQLPQRFGLTYVGQDNQPHTPVIIHRAPFGSLERFMAILIEHTAGKFPLWLAPQQVAIIPISDRYLAYAKEVSERLTQHEIRHAIDQRKEKVGRKIRDAENAKIPYMILVGAQEEASQTVAVRKQSVGNIGTTSIQDLINILQKEQQMPRVGSAMCNELGTYRG
ncbi:MAG: threonine--tRNA ligase [Cytophagales bacterium]